MFQVYADGKPMYHPMYASLAIISPKLTLEMGKAGSLQFGLPPGHQFYGQLRKLKTPITVELDGVEIFRGRVLSEDKRFDNIRSVYCEGDLAYLCDSVQKGEKYIGSTHELFRKIVAAHNARVEQEKQFVAGEINIEDRDIILLGKSDDTTAIDTDRFDYRQIAINSMADDWKTTYDYIDTCLIQTCGGYLRTRREGSVTYLDLLTDFGRTAQQAIQYGVNLLDLTEAVTAEELFTVLIPLGDNNLTIAAVNGGSDELEDPELTATYGRIVKTHVFDTVSQPETLLENGKRYLSAHANIPVTITVRAVDLHLTNTSIPEIQLGDAVQLDSPPHGISGMLTCTKIEYDFENPGNCSFTFGTPRQSLTERYRKDKRESEEKASSGGGGGAGGAAEAAAEEAEKQLKELYDAYINVNPEAGHIDLKTLYEKYQDGKTVLQQTCGITDHIQTLFNGMNVAKTSKEKTRMVLNMIFETALDEGIIARNPMKSRRLRITGRASEPTEEYSIEQMQYLVSHISSITDDTDRAYLALQALHPLRLEEVLGLKWADIDRERMQLHICRAVTHPTRNMPEIKTPKTKASIRILGLSQIALDVLGNGSPEEFVLGGENPLSYTQVRRMCERIRKETGFEDKITPIRFRTTVLTDIYDQTRDIKQAQTAAGHTTAAMTLKYYVKGRGGAREAASAVERAYGAG